ncbi:MAG: hypothetical protein GX640_03200 [Fibrobacter sp.]|nr:hypothetical protein [Fibrobacter sp.]
MEIILKKEQRWIDFIYENTITDLLQGENFRTDFIDENSTLLFRIDCCCNINEKMSNSNVHYK